MTMINVLGTDYSIEFRNQWDDVLLQDSNGYIDRSSKKIIVCGAMPPDTWEAENFSASCERWLRHEIVHAFFYESGMNSWCENEMLVEWIAHMLPVIIAAIESVTIN